MLAARLTSIPGSSAVFTGGIIAYDDAVKVDQLHVDPDVIDSKTSISLKGLKFQKQGDDWIPTAGTITYSFLGQKGVEDLQQFLSP